MTRQAVRVGILLAGAHHAHNAGFKADISKAELLPFTRQVRSWIMRDGSCDPALRELFDSFSSILYGQLGTVAPQL